MSEWENEDLASVKIQVYRGHKKKVSSIHFCCKNSRIFSSSHDCLCKLWNISDGSVHRTYQGHDSMISHSELCISELMFLTCGWDGNVKVWDTEIGSIPYSLRFGGIVTHAEFSKSEKLIVVSSDLDNLITIVDLRSCEKVKTIKGLHKSTATFCSFITDDKRILTTGMDGCCKIFDIRSESVTITLEDHSNVIASAGISPDEHIVATASWDKSILVYDINTGSYRSKGPVKLIGGHEGSVSCCNFSRDSRLLISGGYDSTLVIWDMVNEVSQLKLQGHDDWIEDVKISDDNDWLLSCSKDTTIRLWNIGQTDKIPKMMKKAVEIPKTLECSQCGNKFSGVDDSLCVFCRLKSEKNPNIEIIKKKLNDLVI